MGCVWVVWGKALGEMGVLQVGIIYNIWVRGCEAENAVGRAEGAEVMNGSGGKVME